MNNTVPMEIIIKLTGEDAEQALAELISNIQYDDLDCEVEQLSAYE